MISSLEKFTAWWRGESPRLQCNAMVLWEKLTKAAQHGVGGTIYEMWEESPRWNPGQEGKQSTEGRTFQAEGRTPDSLAVSALWAITQQNGAWIPCSLPTTGHRFWFDRDLWPCENPYCSLGKTQSRSIKRNNGFNPGFASLTMFRGKPFNVSES